ncbi:hypothetical protein F5884DRAFT_781116 [Xylogone sp. PMI_703]|nr:hypothetical protein F5884DRAFT_781116 [Xylogone sp. PMI_703]
MSWHHEPGSLPTDIDLSNGRFHSEFDNDARGRTIEKPAATMNSTKSYPISETYGLPSREDRDFLTASQTSAHGNQWSPGFIKHIPYRGILALFGCLAGIIASIAVIVASDGQPTSNWRMSPPVYLAFFIAATNMLARFAFNEGAKIAWWYKAIRGGTVSDLHDHWTHADGFLPALLSGRKFNFVSLGSIAATVIAIDQPLMQRASNVIAIQKSYPIGITARIAPEIPWGFTSVQEGRGYEQQVMTQPMIMAFNDFNSQAPMTSGISGCEDTCIGYVEAGGFSTECNTTSTPVHYMLGFNSPSVSPFSVNFSISPQTGPDPLNPTVPSRIIMNVAYTNSSNATDCTGLRTEKTCYLTPATLRYSVNVTKNSLKLGDMLDKGNVQAIQPAPGISDTIDIGTNGGIWTVGGLYLAAKFLFASNATYTNGGAIGEVMSLPDTLSNQFLDFPTNSLSTAKNSRNLSYPKPCSSNWTDPTSHILTSLNEMAFRLSLAAAEFPYRNTSVPPAPQHLTMQQTSTLNIFNSEYRFLFASTLLTLLLIGLIVPTFIGWWELGRNMTLNPIETAKAFDAPALQGPGSNAPLEELVRIVGHREIRLGSVESYGPGASVNRRLKLVNSAEVTKPRAGVVYA